MFASYRIDASSVFVEILLLRIASVENTNLEELPFAISTQAAEMERSPPNLKGQPRSQVALRFPGKVIGRFEYQKMI